MGIIFDLDQTLIDSSRAELLRKKRLWDKVYECIPEFKVYDGIYDVFELIENNNISVAIVTSSPKSYCNKVITEHNFPVKKVIAYHDTTRKKPDPDPILKAVEMLDGKKHLSFGDKAADIIASNGANVISVACEWGSNDILGLKNANPKYTCKKIEDMVELIKKYKEFL